MKGNMLTSILITSKINMWKIWKTWIDQRQPRRNILKWLKSQDQVPIIFSVRYAKKHLKIMCSIYFLLVIAIMWELGRTHRFIKILTEPFKTSTIMEKRRSKSKEINQCSKGFSLGIRQQLIILKILSQPKMKDATKLMVAPQQWQVNVITNSRIRRCRPKKVRNHQDRPKEIFLIPN